MDVGAARDRLGRVMRNLWCGILVSMLFAAATRAADPAPVVELRLKHGDDPRWAAPNWDDHDWEREERPAGLVTADLPTRTGVFWVRFHLARSAAHLRRPVVEPFVWPQDEPGSPINSLFVAAVFAYELYWDGTLIGRSGVVGATRETEVAGPIDNLMQIPDALLGPGDHTVALRLSDYHYNFRQSRTAMYLAFENYTDRLRFETRLPITPLVGMAGALLMAAFCAALYWIIDRRPELLWCGGLSVAIAIYYGLIAWRWLHNDPYDWLWPRYLLITAMMTAISLLLTWLLLVQFAVPRRGWWLLGLMPLLLAAWLGPYLYSDKATWQCRAMLVFALAIAGRAVWQRRTGARIVLAGVLIGLVGVRSSDRNFVTPVFLFSFGGLVLCLIAGLGAQAEADRRRAREAQLTAARLETELLKKNIQPHFLLNTLATIVEVIEEEPKTAVALIEALAGEFRILARVADEKLVPLGQELELCRAHLEVMSRRKAARCSLAVHGVDERALVPPALFHTLVENGLTHLLPRDGEQKFELHAERLAGQVRYTLVAWGQAVEAARPEEETRREGTGLRYVKARLEESFPVRWTMAAGPVEGGWRTVIELGGPRPEGGPS